MSVGARAVVVSAAGGRRAARGDAAAATRRSRRDEGGGARARARVIARGAKFNRSDFVLERQIGEGSFGVVYEGKLASNAAGGLRKGDSVVLKRPKLNVEGAAELQEIESWMNDRVSRDARGACAEFVGSYRVTRDEWMASSTGDTLSNEGLWLVWRYQGDRTLAQYLAQPDYPMGLAKELLGREDVVRGNAAAELEITQKAISQLLKSLRSIHRAGLVHRDVKPHNLVLAKENVSPEFKVIDLGACACFRSGTNFTPDETIMDPKYAPPEEFLIPTDDAPDLKKMFGPIALAAGTTAWVAHKPDRFDMYSTGIVLMQLALPSLRTNSGLQGFNRGLKKHKYNLQQWREANKGQLSRSKTAVLDAGDGAGWDLATELLRRRPYEAEDEEEDPQERPSADDALKHRFFRVDPTELAVEVKEGLGDNWVAETAGMLSDMFSLEKRIQRQQANIAKQSTTIQKMKDEGEDAKSIAQEEKTLEKMRVGLQGLVRSLSYKEVEARTTMVSAASELKKSAKDSGVETSEEYDGMITDLSTSGSKNIDMQSINDRVNRAANATRKRVDEGISGILRAMRKERNVVAQEDLPAKFDDDESEAIRQRMEAIQAEMNAVIEEMADMESRLLAQQQALEAQQRTLPSYASSETAERRKSDRKTNGTNGAKGASRDGAKGASRDGANGSSRNGADGASRPTFVEARKKSVDNDKSN